jgi:hypothetical protein
MLSKTIPYFNDFSGQIQPAHLGQGKVGDHQIELLRVRQIP